MEHRLLERCTNYLPIVQPRSQLTCKMSLALIRSARSQSLPSHFKNRCNLDEMEVAALKAYPPWLCGSVILHLSRRMQISTSSFRGQGRAISDSLVFSETHTPVKKVDLGKTQHRRLFLSVLLLFFKEVSHISHILVNLTLRLKMTLIFSYLYLPRA